MKCKYFTIAVILFSLAMPSSVLAQEEPDYETRPFQFTFMFPPLSTNGYENSRIVNNLSLNLFVGVSGGVDGAEFGGFINVDRYFVRGFQAAGFGNTVGGDVEGLQFAGFYNVSGGNVRFVQGAGFVNVTGGGQYGLQGAGFGNVVGGSMTGFQGSGFFNAVGGRMNGLQAAGFVNVNGGPVTGVQGAGFLNVAGGFDEGIQAAGFGNVAGGGTVNLQAAGFFNVADSVSGLQAAGFFNRAGTVKGVMASGFLNVCDSIDGVPIGFINVVRKNGYRSLELAVSETQYVSVSFRMGVERLYTIYSIGKPFGPVDRWMYGLGLGTRFGLTDNMFMNVEGIAQHEFFFGDLSFQGPGLFYFPALNMHNQLRVMIGSNIGNFAEWFVGPTLNVGVAWADEIYDIDPIAPRWALSVTTNRNRPVETSLWFGVRGGIRF